MNPIDIRTIDRDLSALALGFPRVACGDVAPESEGPNGGARGSEE